MWGFMDEIYGGHFVASGLGGRVVFLQAQQVLLQVLFTAQLGSVFYLQ